MNCNILFNIIAHLNGAIRAITRNGKVLRNAGRSTLGFSSIVCLDIAEVKDQTGDASI